MSKFDYNSFYGDFNYLAVSKERYTEEEAVEIAKRELLETCNNIQTIVLENGFVRHRAGRDDEGEPRVCWWLEWEEHKRSCPVFAFHVHYDNEIFYNEHKLIQIGTSGSSQKGGK